MEQDTPDAVIAAETGASRAEPSAPRARLGLYLVLGCILLVGIIVYLVVGRSIASLLQVLTNFSS